MYWCYEKSRMAGKHSYKRKEKCSLFGCNNGFIPWLLAKRIPSDQNEPYKWHVPIEADLNATEEYPGSTLVIDLKPKQQKTNLSLYELLDVWGYSDSGWTPILLHLAGLFVDADPTTLDPSEFDVIDSRREEPIYEFLYLDGTVADGKIAGTWSPPPVSPTNAALLWPESLKYFVRSMRERTPRVFDGE